MFFRFVNVLYREHRYQSTSDGHKSHLCFLIIANRKTNRGCFGSLFVFPIEWHQTGKQRTAYTEEVVFLFFSYLMLQMKNENRYSRSYFYIPFSIFKVGKGKGNLITLFLFSIMESENEKRKDGIYNTWLFSVYPVFILQKKKRKWV